jgi:monoamine oxidase
MSITRRHMLQGTLALIGATGTFARPLQATPQAPLHDDVDVAIVGAGAAGLAAAHLLLQAGKRIAVLEARSRIGGRAFTDTSLGIPFDAGARYIHWGETNPWTQIAQEQSLALINDDALINGFEIYRNGSPLPQDERIQRRRGFSLFSQALKNVSQNGSDQSLMDIVKNASSEAHMAAQNMARFSLGEEPERVSLRDYDALWAGDDWIVKGGYGALVARYGTHIPVMRDCALTHVRHNANGVTLDTSRGTLKARHVILTVPIGVLQAESIRFTPPLTKTFQDALNGIQMGALTKIALNCPLNSLPLARPDMIALRGNGSHEQALSLEFETHDTGVLALAILGGDHARDVCREGEAATLDLMRTVLADIFGNDLKTKISQQTSHGRLANWWNDPFTKGSYSIVKPHQTGIREALRQPMMNRLYYAGEATASTGGAMTVGGATLEGIRAAQAVLTASS